MISTSHRAVAAWVLEQELGDRADGDDVRDAAERACQKLSWRLARLVTVEGYRALLDRSLHLGRDRFPILAGISAGTEPDACLGGLRTVAPVDSFTLHAALTEVLAGMLGLLSTFIGDELTIRIVRDVWPDAPTVGPRFVLAEAEA